MYQEIKEFELGSDHFDNINFAKNLLHYCACINELAISYSIWCDVLVVNKNNFL